MRRLQEIAQSVNGTIVGDSSLEITGAATIARSGSGFLTFAQSQQHYDDFLASDASAVIVGENIELNQQRTAVVVANPLSAFTQIVSQFRPPVQRNSVGISSQATVSDRAVIADGVCIHPGAVIMDGVRIGSGTVVFPNVTVMENCEIGSNSRIFPGCVLYENSIIGDRVILHANVVIGAYGFGYKSSKEGHQLSAQLGNVIIENDVELGANTTVDRGTFDSTVVGAGTKMDNQVMVGHNCKIGKHNLLCSQVGVAGSCTTGDFVVMGGQVGMGDHINIGDNVSIGAKSGLMQDVESNQRIQGIPGRPARQSMQIMAITGKLPELRKSLIRLEKQVAQMQVEQQNDSFRDAA